MSILSTNYGSITDFAPIPTRDIAQNLFAELDRNRERLQARSQEIEAEGRLMVDESEDFVSQVLSSRNNRMEAPEPDMDYNAPVSGGNISEVTEDVYEIPTPEKKSDGSGYKLANYGYDSDTSPDYNSNVLRIGHANNKLEDGVSAALTKSLAKKYGLKTGDFFEITTADGKTMKRRYDDTVPTTYKGRPLPETVDLYERKGSNSFGGKVVKIKPLK